MYEVDGNIAKDKEGKYNMYQLTLPKWDKGEDKESKILTLL